jgi:diguanylate cyclase (GGDEF)-like protein
MPQPLRAARSACQERRVVVAEPGSLTVGEMLAQFVHTFRMHIFSGEVQDGAYVETFTGPGLDALLGGQTAASGEDAASQIRHHVHADDLDRYNDAMRRACAGAPQDIEYRLVGLDGVQRWVRECTRSRRLGAFMFVDGFILDISAIREARAAADATQQHLDRIIRSIPEHLYTAKMGDDGSYHELYTGPGSERFLGGLPDGADPVAAWDDRVHPDDRAAHQAAYAGRRRGESGEVTYRLVGYDGRIRWVSERGVIRCREDDGFVVDGIVNDVTVYKETEQRLREALAALDHARADAERRSRTDELTGIGNRSHLSELLAAHARRPRTKGVMTALLLLDLDNFKEVNDTYGHTAGDAVLVQVARRIINSVRPSDFVARWGGDEFAVLATSLRGPAEVRDLAERLRESVRAAPFTFAAETQPMTTSVGGSVVPPDADLGRVLVEADEALYLAKRQGRDRVRLARRRRASRPDADAAT